MKHLSIKKKLVFITVATCAAVLILGGAALFISDLALARSEMADDLRLIARIIGNNSTAALTSDDPMIAQGILSAFRADGHVIAAAIYDARGKLFAKYTANSPGARIPDRPEQETSRFDSNSLIVFQAIVLDKDRLGTLFIQSDLGRLDERFRRDVIISAARLGVRSPGGIAVDDLAAASRSPIPILKLAATAPSRFGREKLLCPGRKDGTDDEIPGNLIDSFNEMLDQDSTSGQRTPPKSRTPRR